ncbi:DoxX family protein [Nocardioides marmorisolisilvae]|uniref:DoxX family protein n=1 Tax=Nocardioides marmorisolisilvae TaxID=1542737 RepID=A0A3N0DS10_9ACTN|nr:DoxX family protein [Nocardioides marmorisolisilvae]RNL78400.1 hypothetical protein EFL95_04690 [Nocardioides marmorisolisilvae]
MTVPEVGALALAAIFGAGGLQQLAGVDSMQVLAKRVDLEYGVIRVAGFFQTLGALGLVAGVFVATWIGIAAGCGLALQALLGCGAHLRVREPVLAYAPAAVLGAAALAVALTL